MVFQSTIRSLRRSRASGGSPAINQPKPHGFQTAIVHGSVWRHQNVRAAPNTGSANALTTNNYFASNMLSTVMSFNATTPDTPPIDEPTFNPVSNVILGSNIFNGSRVEDGSYSKIIRLKNNDAVTRYLDLYQVTLSFLETTDWVTIMGAGQVPIGQQITGINAGDIVADAPTSGVIDAVNYKNFLTHQHYMQKIGTIELGAAASGENTVTLEYTDVPAKCKYGNYGMVWRLFFHNDFNKNGVTTLNISYNDELSFNEIPSDYRIPFIR